MIKESSESSPNRSVFTSPDEVAGFSLFDPISNIKFSQPSGALVLKMEYYTAPNYWLLDFL